MSTVTCSITCNIVSSGLEFNSGHSRLLEPQSNEFKFELDIENDELVGFQISDFVQSGNSYTVSVVAVRDGGSPQTWTHSSGVSSSPTESDECTLTLTVTATASGQSPLSGGGVIRIQPKGK